MDLIKDFGFPIACVVALSLFIVKLLKRQDERNDRKDSVIEGVIKEYSKDSKDNTNILSSLKTLLENKLK